MTNQELLTLKIQSQDFDPELTIKGYFNLLLRTLWREGEQFSAKRPFGNSGWWFDLYMPLVKARAIVGEVDEDGDVYDIDTKAADKLVLELIDECFS